MNREARTTILTNGTIYTVDGQDWDRHPVKSVAFDDSGQILAVGDDHVQKLEAAEAEIIDLQGRTVLPGLIDSHVHAPGNAFMQMFETDLSGIHTKEETLEHLSCFIREHPEMDAYFAGGFDMSMRGEQGEEPCSRWLDEICPDKPLTVKSSDMHSRWLNTRSIEVSGINEQAQVRFGHIHRDRDGALTGLFTDCKELPIIEPKYDQRQQLEAIRCFMKQMNSWGYTSIMSIAPIMLFEPERYLDLEADDALTLSINAAQMILPSDVEGSVERLVKLRETFAGSKVSITTAKFLVDGVLEGMTACLKEPYDQAAGMAADYRGSMNWQAEELKEAVRRCLKEGLQTHFHCIGDAAATTTLDAIEYGQKKTGRTDLRNVITHLQIVDKSDYRRFGELGVIAAIQPFWHFKEPGWFENVEVRALGRERAEGEYPAASLVRNGAVITASGDYPVSPINDPFHGIQAGVTRNIFNEDHGINISDPEDERFLLGPDERLSLKEMVEAYTINGAYAMFREHNTGSIKEGKLADMIVLDRDIFKTDILDVHKTVIEETFFNGRIVYQRGGK